MVFIYNCIFSSIVSEINPKQVFQGTVHWAVPGSGEPGERLEFPKRLRWWPGEMHVPGTVTVTVVPLLSGASLMSACINLLIFVASQIVKVSQTHIEIKHTSRRTSKTTVIEFGFIKSTTPFCKMRVGPLIRGFFDFPLRFYMFTETDFFYLADFCSGCFLILPEGLPSKWILSALQPHQW